MYTKARQTLRRALARHATTGEMPETFVAEANGYLADIEHKLARVRISLDPKDATLSVDGRPVAQDANELVAGVAVPGLGTSLSRAQIDLVVDAQS